MTAPTYTLYLDETGDPSLEKINLEYPIFALGGLIIEDSLESALQTKLEELKQRIFGRTDLVLHSTDLRKQRGGFAMLGNIALRQQFYSEFNDFIAAAPITFISVAVNKTALKQTYSTPFAPYEWLLELILERFAKILIRHKGTGKIIAEARGKREDKQLEVAYSTLLESGCHFVKKSVLERVIHTPLAFERKLLNGVGLQLCDMMIYPMARAILNNDPSNPAFHIVASKMDSTHGCRVLPRSSQPSWIPDCFQDPDWLSRNYPPKV